MIWRSFGRRVATRLAARAHWPGNSSASVRARYLSSGQSMLIVAMAFIGIIGFVGLAIDTGVLYLHRIWLGQAVDAASLAAGYELPNVRAACVRAVEYLKTNGYEAGPGFSFDLVYYPEPDAPGGDPGEFIINSVQDNIRVPEDCTSPSLVVPAQHENVHYKVGVAAKETVPVAFMSVLGFDTVEVGTPGAAERSKRFDIALVLDKSGSMKFDTCVWYRPADSYACQNRYAPCTLFYSEGFEAYINDTEMQAAGWWMNNGAALLASGGLADSHTVKLINSGGKKGLIRRGISSVGYQDVSLFFWAKDINMYASDRFQVFWRPNSSVGWSRIAEFRGDQLPSSWKQFAVVLPSSASDNPNLEIAFRAYTSTGKGLMLDRVELKSCPQQKGPWVWYKSDWYQGCRLDRPMTCDTEAPETLFPGVSQSSSSLPMAQLMEQPMLDVLLATEKFIQVLDSRRLPGQPREDEIGLATFDALATNLENLTYDYEAINNTLFTQIEAEGATNLGGGMRVGLSILGGGRSDTFHFMVLLTDGWPNYYDYPYSSPTSFGIGCATNDPCRQTLEYIDAQIEAARTQNVTIFTIGLGEDLDLQTFDAWAAYGPGTEVYSGMDLLRRISERTGGEAYHAPTSEELEQIFAWIANAIFVRLTE